MSMPFDNPLRRTGTCTLCDDKVYIDELYTHRKSCKPDVSALIEADKRSEENLAKQYYLHPTISQQQRWWGSFGRHLWCQ